MRRGNVLRNLPRQARPYGTNVIPTWEFPSSSLNFPGQVKVVISCIRANVENLSNQHFHRPSFHHRRQHVPHITENIATVARCPYTVIWAGPESACFTKVGITFRLPVWRVRRVKEPARITVGNFFSRQYAGRETRRSLSSTRSSNDLRRSRP